MTDTYNCEIDILKSIDWQRSNAESFKKLMQHKQAWYQEYHCDFWNDWTKDVFDLRTANDFGLSVWSIILDEPIFGLSKASPSDYPAFGFGEFNQNFENGNFGTNDDSGFNFTTEQRRQLLQLKAYILHMNGSAVKINEALTRIFGERQIICIDNLDMSFTYLVYTDELAAFSVELYGRDLLPRPAGIEIKLVLNADAMPFGFGEYRSNFHESNFYAGIIIGG